MITYCCLCSRSLSDETSKKRRKKLYGSSCKTAKQVMENLLVKSTGLSLHRYEETSEELAYLCFHCDTQLQNISKLEKRLVELKHDVSQKLSSLHELPEPVQVLRKRCAPFPESTPPAKDSRVEPTPGSPSTHSSAGQSSSSYHPRSHETNESPAVSVSTSCIPV